MFKSFNSLKESNRNRIRVVNDFPKKGISFKDISPLIGNKDSYRETLDELIHYFLKIKYTAKIKKT